MARILFSLPPLSPDYSGVASVFHDLRALTILHDASGCTGTYTGYDEPRWFGSTSPVFCSGLREIDAVLGRDEELLEKVEISLKETGAPCVAVIGSPVPMVVGFDFRGFASLAERKLGVPVFGFPATGLGYYDQGQKEAYLALAERLLKKEPPRSGKNRSVNILGASALDGFDKPCLDVLEKMLNGVGLEVAAIWGARSSMEELIQSGKAGANWVVTAAALPLAEFLRKRFGAPFVAGLPIGEKEQGRIVSALEACVDDKEPEQIFPPVRHEAEEGSRLEAKIMIVGEALFCSSMRAYLEEERASEPVKIATFFGEGKILFHPGDQFFPGEDEARRALSSPRLKWVIADPLLKDLGVGGNSPRFTPVPHRAVSGRLYDEGRSRFFGNSGFPD
jgi:nitrogenase molybdenum-iron protein alpha/beta subunit